MSVRTLVTRAVRLDADRRRILCGAVAALAGASAAVKFLPFRRSIRFGSVKGRRAAPADAEMIIERAVWAVEAAARLLPLRAKCIQKGLALQRLLRLRGDRALLHYGVGRDKRDGLAAHVWVEVNGRVVMGAAEMPAYRRVATYS